ncbi:hypothetical protein D3C85_1265120 [compost metagenome]
MLSSIGNNLRRAVPTREDWRRSARIGSDFSGAVDEQVGAGIAILEVGARVRAGIEAALAIKEQLIQSRSAERSTEGRTNPEGRINRPV